MKSLALSFLLASAPLVTAQMVPGSQSQQPGNPSQTQQSADPSRTSNSPSQTQPNDPNAMPATPPGFAPGVGASDAAPARPRAVRISGGVMAGYLVTKVDPTYPDDARNAHISGPVVMSAHIASDGHVKDLAVVSGPQPLQAAAVNAVKQWVYRPFMLNGQPVDVMTVVTVNFDLH